MNPRDLIKDVIEKSRVARHVFVLTVWPFVNLADRLRGYDPVSLRRGLRWARGETDHQPGIRTAGEPARIREPR